MSPSGPGAELLIRLIRQFTFRSVKGNHKKLDVLLPRGVGTLYLGTGTVQLFPTAIEFPEVRLNPPNRHSAKLGGPLQDFSDRLAAIHPVQRLDALSFACPVTASLSQLTLLRPGRYRAPLHIGTYLISFCTIVF